MKYLLYLLYSLYLLLLLMTDLVPSNEWNSIWISGVLAFCTVSFYQISERYANPMKMRSNRMGQVRKRPPTCPTLKFSSPTVVRLCVFAETLCIARVRRDRDCDHLHLCALQVGARRRRDAGHDGHVIDAIQFGSVERERVCVRGGLSEACVVAAGPAWQIANWTSEEGTRG